MAIVGQPLQNVIGIVYDFDGTLSPNNMQEDTIFPAYGINKDDIWKKADVLVREHGYERTLAYLKLLIHDPVFKEKPLGREQLKKLARNIQYFAGVKTYFSNLNRFLAKIEEVERWGIKVEHYIISSGMKEILEGSEIYPHFKRVYACEYEYGDNGPIFPKLVINDTNKTQFLFRISKGKLDLTEDINSHMPARDRPIPFRNMIYIGDSMTDIPSMTVMQRSGGHSIAVFNKDKDVPESVKAIVRDGRADHFAPADYSADSLLIKILHTTLKRIIYQMAYDCSAQWSREWVQKNSQSEKKSK